MKTRILQFSNSFKRILRGTLCAAFLATAVTPSPVIAQDRGDRGDRDSGGRGDFGGRGSMMMMGGGGMGGFDPSAMLSRFDRNGNKMLDPDETQGPAGFFLQRMAQSNPKIDLSKPIPLETIAGEFERMRQERMGGSSFGGGSPWGGGSWGGSQWGGGSWGGSQWGGSPQGEQEQSGPKPLVPTFGIPVPPASVRTFGSADSSEPAVAVTDRDLREAEDRMGRYDRNKDGFLSADELSGGRWSDDPMQYDRNGDGKLSKEELAVRYAKRRIAEEQQQQGQGDQGGGGDSRSSGRSMMFMGGGGMGGGGMGMMGFGGGGEGGGDRGGDRGDRGGDRGREEKSEAKRPKSLRQLSTREKTDKEAGKPEWFTKDDKDTDGQISMAEFSSNWDEGTIADFAKFDLNTDGFITTLEVRKAIANGASRSGGSSRSGSSMASSSRRSFSTDTRSSDTRATETASTSASTNGETKSEMPAAAASNDVATAPATAETKPTTAPESTSADDPKLKRQIEWAAKQIGKYDKNGDGALTPNEYSEMPIPPKNEWDFDGDGRITAEEYARGRK